MHYPKIALSTLIWLVIFQYLGMGQSTFLKTGTNNTKNSTSFCAGIIFEKNNVSLNGDIKAQLFYVYQKINPLFLKKIFIEIYSDTTQTNMALQCQQRLDAVASYFIANQINGSKLQLKINPLNSPNQKIPIVPNKDMIEVSVINEKLVYESIYSLINNQAQHYTFNCNVDMVIYGSKGTKISLLANSLVKSDGSIAKGIVDVYLEEFYTKSDFVLGNLPTQSLHKPLESGGSIGIKIFQNQVPLQLKKNCQMAIEFLGNYPGAPMQCFIGKKVANSFTWLLDKPPIAPSIVPLNFGAGVLETPKLNDVEIDKSIVMVNVEDSEYGARDIIYSNDDYPKENAQLYTLIQTTRLGFINCDRFIDSPQLISFKVPIDTIFRTTNFLVFKSLNAVLSGTIIDGKHVLFENVPANMDVSVLAMSVINKEIYYGLKPYKTSNQYIEKIPIQKSDMSTLKNELAMLNN